MMSLGSKSSYFHRISPLKANLIALLILALALGPFRFEINFSPATTSDVVRIGVGVKRALAANGNTVIVVSSTAATTWTVPSDWNNASNTIEVIGGGGGGGMGASGGGGGGGGAYAKISKFTTSTTGGSVRIQVGLGGASEASGTLTFFDWKGTGSTSTCTANTMSVCAENGGRGVDATAGAGGRNTQSVATSTFGIGTSTFSGGAGAVGTSTGVDSSGGGGGAAGPGGAGKDGALGDGVSTGEEGSGGGGGAGGGSSTAGVQGGANGGNGGIGPTGTAGGTGGSAGNGNPGSNGSGGGGGDQGFSGGAGGDGQEWSSSPAYGAGGGGGGGGGTTGNVGGNGGSYGGGGGGVDLTTGGGTGGQGIIVITYTPVDYEQSAYKWYANNNGTQVGAELTAGVQDASTTLSAAGAEFRLRMLLHVSNATATVSQDNFKLQYASTTAGNCLPGTYGSLPFVDVPTTGSEITYKDNAAVLDGAVYASTSTDPTHGGDTRVDQTYEEANNFTVTSTIIAGRDGRWDFSLVDAGAPAATTYCFRVVKSSGATIATSTTSKIPEIKTAAGANATPTVSSVVLNGGSAIVLTPNATTAISLTAIVSDTDGCSDITGGTTTAMIYRSGITSSTCQGGADNQFCYVATAFTASSTCSGGSINATTTFGVWYFAQATDASSSYSAQNWKGTVIFKDAADNSSSSDSAGVELETLLAITVTTSSINYGTITASSTTSSTNQMATTTNVGNATATYKIRVQNTLTKSADSIATSNQRWATSTFNYDTEAGQLASTALSETFATVSGHTISAATTTAGTAGLRTFWGLRAPSGSPTGTYTGVTEYSSVWLP